MRILTRLTCVASAFFVLSTSSPAFAADTGAWAGVYSGTDALGAPCQIEVVLRAEGRQDLHLYPADGSWIPFWSLSRDWEAAAASGANPVIFHVPRRCGMGCIEGDFTLELNGDRLGGFSAELVYFYGFRRSVRCSGLERVR